MDSISSQKHHAGRRIIILLVIFTFLFSGFVPVQTALAAPLVQQDVPRMEPAACMFDIPAGFTEGQDIECGYLIVPERHEDPDGPTIRLGVAIIYSPEVNPAPDPLVMLQGGPGGSAIDTYTQLLPRSDLIADRDIILLDQRGTLYTEPSLACPEYLEMSIEIMDQDLPDEVVNQRALQAMNDCRDRLVGEGIDLSSFDSFQNAADVDALRRALGYEQINLYGVSYGSLLALHVMRWHPEGLRSVILDAVVPPQINFITQVPQTQNRAFEAMFDACAAETECSQAFPNLRQVFYEQADRMNANPVRVRVMDPETLTSYDALMDGDTFMSLIFQMMYLTDLIPLLPRIIYDARAGNYIFLERIYSVLIFDRTMNIGMYYSVLCAEDADFTLDDYDLQDLPDQIIVMEADSPEFFLNTCEIWDVEELGPVMDEPVVSDIPTLVLSGYFDPITPPAYAEEAAATLSNSFDFVVPWGGHGAATSGECQDSIILNFLRDPTSAPDATCLAAQDAPEFVTPGRLIRLPVLAHLLNLEEGTAPQAIIFFLGLLFLLTALLIYPVVWLIRLLTRTPERSGWQAQPAVEGDAFEGAVNAPATARPTRRPGFYRFAPWLAVLTGLLLVIFTAVFIGVLVNMVLANDWRVLLGLPGTARPLFILPLLAALLTLLMVIAAVMAWLHGAGSVWGRLYFSLLTLAAIASIVILGMWGMLTAVVA
jgi:pimeloyl-ACP methyl ester carboxylesterase